MDSQSIRFDPVTLRSEPFYLHYEMTNAMGKFEVSSYVHHNLKLFFIGQADYSFSLPAVFMKVVILVLLVSFAYMFLSGWYYLVVSNTLQPAETN